DTTTFTNPQAGLPEYNCLVRLAMRLDDDAAEAKFLERAREEWTEFKTGWDEDDWQKDASIYFSLSETLLALYCVTEDTCDY
ncbi:MAG: hypothetical protein KC496_03835, partial [Anaerolineae bacterium]|nr:hypothetical protein [Anaerolineae bacterium]